MVRLQITRNNKAMTCRSSFEGTSKSETDRSGVLFSLEGTPEQLKELLTIPVIIDSLLLAQAYAAGVEVNLDIFMALRNLYLAPPSPPPEAPSARPQASLPSPEQVYSSVDKAEELQPMEELMPESKREDDDIQEPVVVPKRKAPTRKRTKCQR